ncbi:hypothetical protein AJ85_09985 [Alkalihalobacillus alcalophilus ATCC 27647 = CGMCC 1.3604]|uniref:tRNA(Ile)-lysidine synthase n=1 Tax=Alkalihalobacillus alcalophilus ATCC 27647 = CGMCC 1.3604 TaxID=1218173 RepID=A0A4S4K4X4_ALKAL|nr:tRNA lysidine(34) synthetase TilS [Alkalihalobacillus alcalophilus]MED1561725.1 tRNA lysidine(34) synthetase TilS [Alkalihalobacillus alcalophilus]THG92390.1 hypothetical protein AJ85_09985 [Alkalihalobacillus alcalophilus ATCC 27647 = CGMCC 1.3604]
MKQSVHDFVEKNQLFTHIDQVIVATSGGPDSMALLHYLWGRQTLFAIKVRAVHAHHQLRGDEADCDEQVVSEFCQEKGIPFETKRLEVTRYAKAEGVATQLAARHLRYQWLQEFVTAENIAIVTAHHADDQIETILMKQIRGYTPLQSPGIKKKRPFGNGYLIRPFLGITKEEIENYCKEEQIPFRVDSSNYSSKYTRNRYRKEILPFIKSENSQAHVQIQRQSDWSEDDHQYLQDLAKDAFHTVVSKKEEGFVTISQERFQVLRIPLQRRVIHLILSYLYGKNSPFISSIHIEQIIELFNSKEPSKQIDVGQGLVVYRDYLVCHFSRKDTYHVEAGSYHNLEVPGNVHTQLGDIFAYELREGEQDVARNKYYLQLPANIPTPFCIRTRRPGDWIEAKGMTGTKKLNRLFIDRKISQSLRDRWPIVLDARGQIIWVPLLMKSRVADLDSEGTKKIGLMYKPTDEILSLFGRN